MAINPLLPIGRPFEGEGAEPVGTALSCAVCLVSREGEASEAVTIIAGTAVCHPHITQGIQIARLARSSL